MAVAEAFGTAWAFPGSLAGAMTGGPSLVQPADMRPAASRAGRNTPDDRRKETARIVRPAHLLSGLQKRRSVLVVTLGTLLFNTLPWSLGFTSPGRSRPADRHP